MESLFLAILGINAGTAFLVLAILAWILLGSASGLLLTLVGAALWLLSAISISDIWQWIVAHPGLAVTYVGGYFLVGTIWSRIWFQIQMSRVKAAYNKAELDAAIAADKQDPELWQKVVDAVSGPCISATLSTKNSSKVLAIVYNMAYSLCHRGVKQSEYVVAALIQNDAPAVFTHLRSQLVHQIWEYPLHAVDFLLRDFVADICRFIVKALRHVYESIAASYGKEIRSDFEEVLASKDKDQDSK